jgi:thioredoxin reductase (NADPH)
MSEGYDVIIIGAGPAGLTAGLYCAQAGLKVVALEGESLGGQVMNIEKIENYPGFAEGVSGPELGQAITMQAMNYGLELKIAQATGLEIESKNKRVKTTDTDYVGKAMIIANGGRPMKLGVPEEDKFEGKGVAYCAMCEGGQFRDKTVVVAGGGDGGVTEALYLTKIASKVIIVEIMPGLNATALLQQRARENEKIEIMCGMKIEAIVGDNQIRSLQLRNMQTEEVTTLEADGVLVDIGWEPQTKYLEGVVPLDEQGYVMVNEAMETEVPGIFAAGDIRHGSPRQVASAVGDGTIASIVAQKYLREVY